MKNEDDFYDILGVDEDASASEIRRAYLDLSRQLHPDKYPDASPAERNAFTQAFQRMNQAYVVLRDDREAYDIERMNKKQSKATQSGVPEYHTSNTERFKTSSAKEAPSHSESSKTEKPGEQDSRFEKNEREQKSEEQQQTNEDDLYDILGVSEDASASEIVWAYCELSRKFHPDNHPHASPAERNAYTEAFWRVQQAYEVLRDYRESYDMKRMYKKYAKQSGFPEYDKTSTERNEPKTGGESSKTEKPAEQDPRSEKNEREQKSEEQQQQNDEDDYYYVLGIDEDASVSEIMRAYCEQYRKFHPDNHPHASPAERKAYAEAFRRVQQAYEVLRDYREAYDMNRMYQKQAKAKQSAAPEYDKTSTERNKPKTGGESEKPGEQDSRFEKSEREQKSEKQQQTNEDDLYDILGVNENASASEIRQAYFELFRKLDPGNHPYASPEEKKTYTEAFQRVQQAFDVLRDYRESYDMKRLYKKYAKQSGFPEYPTSNTEQSKPSPAKEAPSRDESSKTEKKPPHQESKSEKNEREHTSQKEQQSNEEDYYDILGINEDASASEIVWAYCELARKFYPHNRPHASPAELNAYAEAFRRVQQAYEVLRDYRESYDMNRMYKKYAKQSSVPDYPTSNTERSKPSSAKEAPSRDESSKAEQKPAHQDPRSEKNNREQKSEKQQQNAKPSHPNSNSHAREPPTFGTHADGQPCRWCQAQNKFCFQHVHQDPRFHQNEQNHCHSAKQQSKAKTSHSGSGNNARQAHTFGTHADGQPCRRCQTENTFCFQHVHQDPRFHQNEQNHRLSAKQQSKAKTSHSGSGNNARQAHTFGTCADGQPCRRCQTENTFCFQHVHQDPRFHQNEQNHRLSAKQQPKAKASHPNSNSRTREKPTFGIRADGQPCRRCQMQNKYCFQHVSQDPR